MGEKSSGGMSIKDQIPENEKRWYAVKCKWRCEINITLDLIRNGIEAYVPMQKKVRQYASRKKVSEAVLIPSHVFVKISRDQYLAVLKHHHVFNFLNFSGVVNNIPQREMELMKRVVGEYEDVSIENKNYQLGDRVQIIGGELTGLEGQLIESTNHNFKIALESLGMGLHIYVDPKHLLKMGSTKKVA